MNKFLQKLAKVFLGLSMAAGVGVAVSAGKKDSSPVLANKHSFTDTPARSMGNDLNNPTTSSALPNSGSTGWVTSPAATSYDSSGGSGYSGRGFAWASGADPTITYYSSGITWSKVVVVASTNAGASQVSIVVKVGGTTYSPSSTYVTSGTASANTEYAFTGSSSGNVQVVITNKKSDKTAWVLDIGLYNPSYTLTFNANGGTGTVPSNITGSGSKTLPSSAPNLSKTGYTLDGWGDNDHKNNASAQYALGAAYTLSTDITLYAHWTANKYSVTASITDGGFTGATGANAATYGTAYNATITANTNYALPTSLTVTMGGSPTNAYTYNSGTGAFSIAAPTGNISISGSCTPDGGTEYVFSYELSHCSIADAPESMYDSQIKELQIVPDDHYKLPADDANKVSVTGAVDWYYDEDDGTITIDGAEDDLTVSVECIAKETYDVTLSLTNVTKSSGPSGSDSVEEGEEVTIVLAANANYALPATINVTMGGSTLVSGDDYTWTKNTGTLYLLELTGDLAVTVVGEAKTLTSLTLTISTSSGNYVLGDEFIMPTTVTATFNTGSENVSSQATASGGGLSNGVFTTTGNGKTVTISYTYGNQTATATYTANVTTVSTHGARYEKVTSTANIVSGGKYLIVNETASVAFNGTSDVASNCVSYTLDGSYITTSASLTACEVTITYDSQNSRYSIVNSAGKYVGRTASSNGIHFNDSAIYNKISFSSNNAVIRGLNGDTETYYMRYNNGASDNRFRYYNNTQEAVQLYRYEAAVSATLKWITAEVKSGTYYQGDSVISSNFTVTAHYDNGTTSTPTSDITVTNGYLANIGANTVTLTYSGKSCNVSVSAVEQTAEYTGLSWAQGEYAIIDGQAIDFSKLGTVTAEYDDGDAYASKAIASCGVATYTKSGDVYTKVADLDDGDTITSSSHGKYLGVTYTETNTFTAYSSAPIYVVESIEDVFVQEQTYTWTKVSSIAVGDTVLLTGTKADGTAPYELSGVTSNSGTIASFPTNPAGTYRLTVVAGASSGSFAFKDADDNYLYHNGTDKTLSLSDELTDASSWTVEFDSETPTKATVTNVDSGNPLQYNPGNYFRVYASASQQPIQFYKGESSLTPTGDSIANTNVAVQKAVLEFAAHFNETMACVNGGTTSNVSGKWSTLSSDFTTSMSAIADDNLGHFKALFANAYSVEGGDSLQDMLARYDYIIAKYKLSDDFLHDGAGRAAVAFSPNVSPLINIVGENANTIAIIVIISMVSVGAIGGYFFIRRRKENI